MKSEQLMTLALRVVAVIIAAYACVDLSNILGFLIVGNQWMSTRAVALASLGRDAAMLWSIPVIVSILLWWLAPRLSRLACRRGGQELDVSQLDVERLTHAAFVVVGVWVLLFGLAGLTKLGFVMLSADMEARMLPWNDLAAYVLRCLLALVLIVGGRGLSRFLLHLRVAGTE